MPCDWNEPVVGENPSVWTLNRQTTLPLVSEGRASGAALRAPSPPFQSWRLPGLLFLYGTLDDHDRLGTRRSSSAGKCSSRRAAHHAPRTEGWRRATPQTTPTARRSAPPPAPSGGGQSLAIDPAGGIGKYPSGLCMGIRGPLHYRANVEIAVTSRGPAERGEGSRDTGHQMKRG